MSRNHKFSLLRCFSSLNMLSVDSVLQFSVIHFNLSLTLTTNAWSIFLVSRYWLSTQKVALTRYSPCYWLIANTLLLSIIHHKQVCLNVASCCESVTFIFSAGVGLPLSQTHTHMLPGLLFSAKSAAHSLNLCICLNSGYIQCGQMPG